MIFKLMFVQAILEILMVYALALIYLYFKHWPSSIHIMKLAARKKETGGIEHKGK